MSSRPPLASLGPRGEAVTVELPERLPRILTDPVLLERAVANLIDNALIHAGGIGLRIEAGTGRRSDRHPDHRPRPGHPHAEDRDRSSSRSNAWATRRTGSASVSAWPWPAASWRRWAGSSMPRTRPVAAAPW